MAESRLVVVLLRGGLDGLSAVAPYGERNLARLRPDLVLPEPGCNGGLLDLGGFWGLHPALPNLHRMFMAGEMLAVQAVAGPWRTRSHFEALNRLETGAVRGPGGWLNRLAALLDDGTGHARGLALGAVHPLILQGSARVAAWAVPWRPLPPASFHDRLAAMRAEEPMIGEAVDARRFAAEALAGQQGATGAPFAALAASAGRLMGAAGGPVVTFLELDGWDTHANQPNNLAWALTALDDGLAALRDGLDAAWARTVVLVMTEFGRTVRQNGTGGTDHGTGGVAFVLGGRVAGGVVRGEWPGLGEAQRLEGRDLQPTTDLRALIRGLLGAQFGLGGEAVEHVLPRSADADLSGLLRS